MLRRAAVGLIRVYQKTLSLDHGPMHRLYPEGFCRYYPSCSEYTAQTIQNRGVIIGIAYGTWRICRCNPFSKGGFDPAPEKRSTNRELRITNNEAKNSPNHNS